MGFCFDLGLVCLVGWLLLGGLVFFIWGCWLVLDFVGVLGWGWVWVCCLVLVFENCCCLCCVFVCGFGWVFGDLVVFIYFGLLRDGLGVCLWVFCLSLVWGVVVVLLGVCLVVWRFIGLLVVVALF